MVVLRRPSNFEEGEAQLRTAVEQTRAAPESQSPRAKVWRACSQLLRTEFLAGMRALYDANAIVSFLFNTIVPHVEERLRYDTLQEEHDRAAAKPDAVAQNTARFQAILGELAKGEAVSKAKPNVDPAFAAMRDAMCALHRDATVIEGLCVLYVSTKTARGALDLIFKRLIDAYNNDTSIVQTTEIPMEAMLLR